MRPESIVDRRQLAEVTIQQRLHAGSLGGLNKRLSELETLFEVLEEQFKALRTEIKALWKATKDV